MEDKYKYVIDHYKNDYSEDERFTQDRAHSVEYLTTKKYIEKFLKPGDRILEVGAATGAYSLYYAALGYQVDALDLVDSNIDILKSKVTKDMNISPVVGTALDLSRYDDNTFDMTLVLGPLYHLYTDEDRRLAIREAVRVTKPNGYLYFAYLPNDAVFANYVIKKRHLLETDHLCEDNYRLKNVPEEVFSTFYVSEFEKMMEDYPVEFLHDVATDGICYMLKEYVNELSDEEFNVLLDYHYSTCERKDLNGYSSHMLYIGRKK